MGGVIVDTSVFVQLERRGQSPDFAQWASRGQIGISAITLSELWVGVHRADSERRRAQRKLFMKSALVHVAIIAFDEAVAAVHAALSAHLAKIGQRIGPHDLIIAATAVHRAAAVLTANTGEFSRIHTLEVLTF